MSSEEETPRQRAARLRREKIAQNAESRTAFIFDTIKAPVNTEPAITFSPATPPIQTQEPTPIIQNVQTNPQIPDNEPKMQERAIEKHPLPEKPKEKPNSNTSNNSPKVSNSQSEAQKEAQLVMERARKQSKNVSSSKIPFYFPRILISILCGAIFVIQFQFAVFYTFLVLDLTLVGASLLFAEKKTGIMDNIAALKYLSILKDLLSQLLFTSKTLSVFLFVTVVTSLLINN